MALRPTIVHRRRGEFFENLTLLNKNIERHRQSTNVVEEMRKQTVQDGSRIEEHCSEKQTLYQ